MQSDIIFLEFVKDFFIGKSFDFKLNLLKRILFDLQRNFFSFADEFNLIKDYPCV